MLLLDFKIIQKMADYTPFQLLAPFFFFDQWVYFHHLTLNFKVLN